MDRLIAQLRRLPGIGGRSAERLALHLLLRAGPGALELARAIQAARDGVAACGECGFFRSAAGACPVCCDEGRDHACLCVVEQAADVLPIERTAAYRGGYHVLGGKISPLEGVHPEHLRIEALLRRVQAGGVAEVILAVGSDVEGEATAHYLAAQLAGAGVKLTRLAQGLPAGGGLDHVDELTLLRALSGRRTV